MHMYIWAHNRPRPPSWRNLCSAILACPLFERAILNLAPGLSRPAAAGDLIANLHATRAVLASASPGQPYAPLRSSVCTDGILRSPATADSRASKGGPMHSSPPHGLVGPAGRPAAILAWNIRPGRNDEQAVLPGPRCTECTRLYIGQRVGACGSALARSYLAEAWSPFPATCTE